MRDLTARLKRPEGTMTLRPIQAWTLLEAPLVGGCIANITIGGGKSLIGMLMPMVMPDCQRAVLLIPADLRSQFYDDWKRYGQHWKLPNLAGGDGGFIPGRPVLHVMSYQELSHKKGTDALIRINPDLVAADECQAIANIESVRGDRFFNFFPPRPWARFTGWSASIMSDSIMNFCPLFVIALGGNSPAPVDKKAMKEWAGALDPDHEEPRGPGALMRFCLPGEDVYSGVSRRFTETVGFIATGENELKVPIVFRKRVPPPMPEHVVKAYRKLKRKDDELGGWVRPDGEVLEDQLQVVDCARDLSVGLYLRWIFPRGEPKELIDLWFEVRTAWNRELRAALQGARTVFMDSPSLCEDAAKRWYDGGCPECNRLALQPHGEGCKTAEFQPLWAPYSYPAWREIEDKVQPVSQTVWMDEWLVNDVVRWLGEHTGIVWVEHPELGLKLAQMTGLPYYGDGEEAHAGIRAEDGKRSIIASIQSHHKGKNLQGAFNKNLIVQWPSSAELVEQTCGRTHREGQEAAEVGVWYYAHTVELEGSLETSMERAKSIQGLMKTAQKMNYGRWEDAALDALVARHITEAQP